MARHTPLVLTVAPTGARYHPSRYPAVPITPAQVVSDIEDTYREGARFFHLHARNPVTGEQFANLQWYRDVLHSARSSIHPRLPIGVATSRKGIEVEVKIAEASEAARRRHGGPLMVADRVEGELLGRGIGIYADPDTATNFSALEILAGHRALSRAGIRESLASYPAQLRWTDPSVVRGFYCGVRALANRLGVRQEFEVTTAEAFRAIEDIAGDPSLGIDDCLHVVFLFGFSNRLRIERRTYELALGWLERLRRTTGVDARVSVGAVIPPHRAAAHRQAVRSPTTGPTHFDYEQVLEWVLEDDRVDAFRVGLEDTPVLYGHRRSNAWLVRHAREIIEAAGTAVETDVAAVRTRLGLNP